MCFYNDNQNFIRIKLFSEMKGLTYSEKLKKYETLKNQVYKRLKNSYSNCWSKINFYKDAFKVLGFYEEEYLMLNLFLEKNSTVLVDELLKENYFADAIIRETQTVSSSFYNYIIKNRDTDFTNEKLIDFIKESYMEVTQSSSDADWKNENKNSHPLVHKFYDFFSQVSKDKLVEQIFAYFVMLKIWNFFEDFNKPFNNTKGIILYDKLIQIVKEKDDFLIFYRKVNEIIENLLVELDYIPIIDDLSNDKYKKGYILKRNLFLSELEILKKRDKISCEMSYYELLENMNESADEKLIDICRNKIVKKIDKLEYPDSNEMKTINNISENNKNINDFFQKLYIY